MDGISYKKWMERAAGLFLSALIAVLLTMLFLAVFAFAMLKGNLSASVEKIGLIVMSVMACFVGGFLCGKKNIKKRKCLPGVRISGSVRQHRIVCIGYSVSIRRVRRAAPIPSGFRTQHHTGNGWKK